MKAMFLLVCICISLSCNKDDNDPPPPPDDGIKQEDKDRAASLQTYLQQNGFQLKRYYSEVPIDYIDTDQVVKEETDLWQYVSPWLKDDRYVFGSNGQVTVEQNAIRIASDSAATLSRTYSVAADKDGVAFNFIGHEYQPLNYRLESFSEDLLKVSATWNGKEVISEYEPSP